MSISDDVIELEGKVKQLLAMLELLEKQGEQSAELFADGVRHRLAELQKTGASEGGMGLATRLLDIVPSAKDLDGIDFRLDLHPGIGALRSAIEARGAGIARSIINAL